MILGGCERAGWVRPSGAAPEGRQRSKHENLSQIPRILESGPFPGQLALSERASRTRSGILHPYRPAVDDEEGFSRGVELAILQPLAVAHGERATVLFGAGRGAEMELHLRLRRRHMLPPGLQQLGQGGIWTPVEEEKSAKPPGGNPTSCTPRRRVVPVPRGSPLNPPSLSKAGSATRGALPAAVQQVRAVQSRRTSLLMAGDGRTEGRTDGRTAGLGGCGAL